MIVEHPPRERSHRWAAAGAEKPCAAATCREGHTQHPGAFAFRVARSYGRAEAALVLLAVGVEGRRNDHHQVVRHVAGAGKGQKVLPGVGGDHLPSGRGELPGLAVQVFAIVQANTCAGW